MKFTYTSVSKKRSVSKISLLPALAALCQAVSPIPIFGYQQVIFEVYVDCSTPNTQYI